MGPAPSPKKAPPGAASAPPQPSSRQATAASRRSQPSSHTVPQRPPCHTSRRPAHPWGPSARRSRGAGPGHGGGEQRGGRLQWTGRGCGSKDGGAGLGRVWVLLHTRHGAAEQTLHPHKCRRGFETGHLDRRSAGTGGYLRKIHRSPQFSLLCSRPKSCCKCPALLCPPPPARPCLPRGEPRAHLRRPLPPSQAGPHAPAAFPRPAGQGFSASAPPTRALSRACRISSGLSPLRARRWQPPPRHPSSGAES